MGRINFRQGDFPFGIAETSILITNGWSILGSRKTIESIPEDISELTANTIPMPDTTFDLELVSTSTNDTDAGTGANTVLAVFLDDNFDTQSEIIVMNSTSPVTMTNRANRINRLFVLSAGSLGSAAGTISLQQAEGGDIFSNITVGNTTSKSSLFTVPRGFRGLVSGWSVSSISTGLKAADVELVVGNIQTVPEASLKVASTVQPLFYPVYSTVVMNDGFSRDFTLPECFPELVDIKARAVNTSGGTIDLVNISYQLFLARIEPN